ncbi:MAG: hypothetical protein ACRBCL_15895 [Maritimibacter sp.]
MKVVAYAYSGADAALVISRLEACEIPVFSHDFHTAIVDCKIGGAMGGIRIVVPNSYTEEALVVLADAPLPSWRTPRLIPLIVMTLATVMYTVPIHPRGTILATPNGRYSAPAQA